MNLDQMPPLKASIDIGTNTVLLLVAEVGDGSLTVLEQAQRTPRLGKGVDDGHFRDKPVGGTGYDL